MVKLLLVLGADNASDVADPQLAEQALPHIALRDPQTDASGSATLQLPGSFPGGPADQEDGTGADGTYNPAPVGGSVVDNVRMLVRHNAEARGLGGLELDAAALGTITVLEVAQDRILVVDIPPVYAGTSRVIATNASGVVSTAIGGLQVNDRLVFYTESGGPVANGPLDGLIYYVHTVVAANQYRLKTTPAGGSLTWDDWAGADQYSCYEPPIVERERDSTSTTVDVYVDELQRLQLDDTALSGETGWVVGETLSTDLFVPNDSGLAVSYLQPITPLADDSIPGKVDGGAVPLQDRDKTMHLQIGTQPITPGQVVAIDTLGEASMPTDVPAGSYFLVDAIGEAVYVASSQNVGIAPGNNLNSDLWTTDAPHGLLHGERVKLSGEFFPFECTWTPDNDPLRLVVTEDTEFFVALDHPSITDAETEFGLRLHPGNDFFGTGNSFPPTIEPNEWTVRTSRRQCYRLASDALGTPVVAGDWAAAHLCLNCTSSDVQRGSLTGYGVTFTGGSADGLTRELVNVERDATSPSGIRWQLSAELPAPATWTTVAITGPQQNGDSVDPETEWGLFLPWSPFEGRHDFGEETDGTLSWDAAASEWQLTVEDAVAKGFRVGRSFQMFDPGAREGTNPTSWSNDRWVFADPPPAGLDTSKVYLYSQTFDEDGERTEVKLSEGVNHPQLIPIGGGSTYFHQQLRNFEGGATGPTETYWVVAISGDAMQLSRTRGGEAIASDWFGSFATAQSRSVKVSHADHIGKRSPYPPGFNYPSSQRIPTDFQVHDGRSPDSRAALGLAVPTAHKFAGILGEPVYVVPVGLVDSSVGPRTLGSTELEDYAWFSAEESLSWSPSLGSAFRIFQETLAIASAALLAEGESSVECVAVVWAGGDVDAQVDELAESFGDNFSRLKDAIRDEVASRGWSVGDVPFFAVELVEDGDANRQAINAALRLDAEADTRFETIPVATLVDTDSGAGLEPSDGTLAIPPI